MVAIPAQKSPTLAAIDRELERIAALEPRRSYLGASQIGRECERQLWYSSRPDMPRLDFDAATIRRFQDGHRGEAVMAERLRLVPGIELHTHDEGGNQFRFSDLGGRYGGHCDGFILGILQAPLTPHIWEHKQVGEKKFAELKRMIEKAGQKSALRAWDFVYYAQAVAYMDYFDTTRHYLTASTPGGRDYLDCRTDADPKLAAALRGKAARIVEAREPPARLSDNPSFFKCKSCEFREICHG